MTKKGYPSQLFAVKCVNPSIKVCINLCSVYLEVVA